MWDVALRTLAYDRGKLAASLSGVALATALVVVQVGLFSGFLDTSSALIRRVGGDVWVMARGTEVLDNGEALSPSTRAVIEGRACVSRVRALVVAIAPMRKPSGALDYVQVIGTEPWQRPLVPWNLIRGLHADLHAPLRVAVDEHDLDKLQLVGDPLGGTIEVAGRVAHVAAITEKIRSFALYPYLFTEAANARELVGLGADEAQYWVADLEDPSCADELVRAVSATPGLDAHRTLDFAARTERFWVFGSGAGAAIGFSAVFSLFVGAIIVGQTLYTVTKQHLKELATLKAMGATSAELVGFVGWQAAFLAFVGGGAGLGLAAAISRALTSEGVEVVLSQNVVALGALAVTSMCVGASVPSALRVLRVDAAEVFK